MIQLLTRLLAALDEGGQPIAGHLDALQQWLPTAWAACHGEQLLMEAVLDAASAMLAVARCPRRSNPGPHPRPHPRRDPNPHPERDPDPGPNQARPAPLPLLLASLQLVDAATQPDGAGGMLHAAGGLMEVALRLWKSALASLHPALRAEPALAAGFGALAARLPLVLELGDELLRPSMFVLDWCALQDAHLLACGGRFAAAHGGMMAALLEGALARNPERRGALAAIGLMHTLLICAPADSAEALGPPLAACARTLTHALTGEGANELLLAAMAGVLGRALLSAPSLFEAALAACQTADALPRLATAWLQLGDSILLSAHRKLAAVALGQMLGLDAAMLPLAPEVLSFAVSVLAEQAPRDEPDSPPRRCESARFAHEHAEFAAALEASGLDPVRGLELRATLQQCVARAAAAHGAAFGAAMQALDPDLMAQVQAAFGS